MTQRNLKAGGIGVVAVMLALALLVAPVMAAAPTVDSETANTSTTSDWTDGTSVVGFEANSSNTSYIEAEFDSTNASMQVTDPATDEVHAENASLKQTYADSTNNTWHYAWNLSHDELATMPMDAGENKSITVKFINDTSLSSPDTTTITVYLENVNDRAVVYGGDEAAAGNVAGLSLDTEVDEPFSIFGMTPFGENESTSTLEADGVGLVNATGTDVHVIMANTSGEDPFTEAEENKFWGTYGEEDYIPSHQLRIEGHPHAVFHTTAPDGVADGYTYAETTTINGHDAYTVHVDEDYEGETALDVTAVANDKYGFLEKRSVRSDAFDSRWAFVSGSMNTGGGLVA